MSAVLPPPVDYVAAARRHFEDAHLLLAHQRPANAGQLLGFTMECGLKALLIACGVRPDADGSVPDTKQFRQHMPVLSDRVNTLGNLIPDGPKAQAYLARIPGRGHFDNWRVEHRYFRQSEVPLASLPAWESAAKEMNDMLDQAITDGVM
jgi:hypothetical protein